MLKLSSKHSISTNAASYDLPLGILKVSSVICRCQVCLKLSPTFRVLEVKVPRSPSKCSNLDQNTSISTNAASYDLPLGILKVSGVICSCQVCLKLSPTFRVLEVKVPRSPSKCSNLDQNTSISTNAASYDLPLGILKVSGVICSCQVCLKLSPTFRVLEVKVPRSPSNCSNLDQNTSISTNSASYDLPLGILKVSSVICRCQVCLKLSPTFRVLEVKVPRSPSKCSNRHQNTSISTNSASYDLPLGILKVSSVICKCQVSLKLSPTFRVLEVKFPRSPSRCSNRHQNTS